MMTEEEAKKKWCPQTFNVGPICNEYGEPIRDAGPRYCLGSACMAWRTWNVSSQNYDERIFECRDRGMTLEHAIKFVNEHSGNVGYCGLAVRP